MRLLTKAMCRRPMYCELASLRGPLVTQIVACTATADEYTVQQIQQCLGMQDNTVIISMPIRRENLSFYIVRKHTRTCECDLIQTIRRSSAQRVLLFCRKRDETERVAKLMTRNDVKASVYHSALVDRSKSLQAFVSGTVHSN
jgi:superfamily II DNA helicase RecQ